MAPPKPVQDRTPDVKPDRTPDRPPAPVAPPRPTPPTTEEPARRAAPPVTQPPAPAPVPAPKAPDAPPTQRKTPDAPPRPAAPPTPTAPPTPVQPPTPPTEAPRAAPPTAQPDANTSRPAPPNRPPGVPGRPFVPPGQNPPGQTPPDSNGTPPGTTAPGAPPQNRRNAPGQTPPGTNGAPPGTTPPGAPPPTGQTPPGTNAAPPATTPPGAPPQSGAVPPGQPPGPPTAQPPGQPPAGGADRRGPDDRRDGYDNRRGDDRRGPDDRRDGYDNRRGDDRRGPDDRRYDDRRDGYRERDPFNAPGRPGYVPGGFRDDDAEYRDYGRVRRDRREYDVDGRTYYREPGRIIVRDRDGYFIRHDENERFREIGRSGYGGYGGYRSERRDGFMYSYIDRPGGEQIVTVVDDDGRLVRRYRRFNDGREVYLINNSYGPRGPRPIYEDVVDLPPPDLSRYPRERYVVDYGRSDARTVYGVLTAPPVVTVDRRYTLDQVRYSPQLRARMPSVDINTITFDSGSFTVTPEQGRQLQSIADAINQAVQANPQEVFLIEGYTDAVGEEVDNLSLSDRRAQSVATILTQDFKVPPENLTTQGYGEQYMKVNTQEANRENRRVTVRRITPLLQQQAEQGQGQPPPAPAAPPPQ